MEAKSTRQPQPQSTKDSAKPEVVTEPTVEVDAQPTCTCSNKVGIIVGIALGAIIAALLVFAGVWAHVYTSPAKVASDAMNKLFSAENVALDGSILLESTNQDSELRELIVFFDSASTSLPSATHVAIRGALEDETQISIDVGTVQMQDGVIYLQLNGIIDTLTEFGIEEDDLGWIYEAVEVIDNEWWRIDMREIATALEFDQEDAKRLEDLQSCIAQEMDNDIRSELGSLYRSNDFIDLVKVDEVRFEDGSTYGKSFSDTSYYSLVPDYHKMAGFVNGLPDLNTVKRLNQCVQDNYPGTELSTDDFNEVTASELERALDGSAKTEVFLEISKWGHELKHLVARIADEDAIATINLSFTYQEAKVSAPDSYRPITELVDELTELVTEFYQEIYMENNSGATLI